MRNAYRWLLALGMLVLGLVVAAPPAQALVFDLTSDHCTGSCGTAPFGTVTVTQNGTSVDIVVDLADGYSFAKTGSADDMAFKFNGVNVALGDISVDNPVDGETLSAAAGSFNGDGTGPFGFGIQCVGCGPGGSDTVDGVITFHIADALVSQVTAKNSLGMVFVADVLAPNGNTGPVDATVSRDDRCIDCGVPEPSSLLLLGGGLVGLGVVRRLAVRRRS